MPVIDTPEENPSDGGPSDGGPVGGDAPPPSGGDPGPAFLRDCGIDPSLCAAEEPVCFTLASGGQDAQVTLWHVAKRAPLLALPGVRAQVNGLAFSPAGNALAAATHDGSLVLWRTAGRPRSSGPIRTE